MNTSSIESLLHAARRGFIQQCLENKSEKSSRVCVTVVLTPSSISCFRPRCQMENAGYELERLYTDVTSLCSRIELLPCRTAKDRLAQSGKRTTASLS